MVNNFDRAFLHKLKKVWSNTQYANLAIAYYNVYDKANDPTSKLELPLINIYRPEGFELKPNQTISARLSGLPIKDTINEDNEYLARYLTASLDYQIDIYATSTEMLDKIALDIMQMFSFDPHIYVTQTDKSGRFEYTEFYDIIYKQGPRDVSEFEEGQRLYRYALVYQIENAKLINFKQATTISGVSIDLDLVATENTHKETITGKL